MGALGLGRVCGRLLNLDASYRTVFKVTHEEVTGREFLAKGVGCYVGSKFAALCPVNTLALPLTEKLRLTEFYRFRIIFSVTAAAMIPRNSAVTIATGAKKISAGINCEGSLKCNGQPHDTAKVLVGYINGIDSGRYYDNGEHIAGPGPMPGERIKNVAPQLLAHGCTVCGSVPTGPNNDDSGGQLTFNFIAFENKSRVQTGDHEFVDRGFRLVWDGREEQTFRERASIEGREQVAASRYDPAKRQATETTARKGSVHKYCTPQNSTSSCGSASQLSLVKCPLRPTLLLNARDFVEISERYFSPTCTLQRPTANKMSSEIYGNGENPQGALKFAAQLSSKSRSKRSLHVHHSERRPIDKFRSTVNKVIAMKRSTTILASIGAGAEPGIDPRRASMEMQYRSVHKECAIEIVDYSAVSSTFLNMRNSEFVDWCSSPRSKRQPWVKVRWINITGVSWDVIKALSLKHGTWDFQILKTSPLALEDVLHTRPDNVSKADYFVHHLFLRVLIHEVADESTPTFVAEAEGMDPSAPAPSKCALRERQIEQAKIDALKQGTLRVNVSPMFVFLYRDGTVITITQHASSDLLLPISDRLRRADTILRSSADPSMLVQSFLALIVDKAIELIDAYHHQISQIEGQILLNPKPSTVRKLHIVSGDLVLHKRTLEPIKTLCYGLRRYDTDRCAALVDDSDEAAVRQPIVGFMSHKSKIYLADITDNTEYILSTLDMIAGIGESLTDYSFNASSSCSFTHLFSLTFVLQMASYSMNDTMRLLTMITIICLPLTFVSGYFGMNFSNETWIAEWSDVLFWIIALPCVVVISPLFIIPDLKRIWHYIQTRRLLKGFK
ncbi:hypothetical protein K438DRAFT_1757701 [Mycena galopus ATCC 62051]|nr:hypothetical protein K438DRAFT_1757701 [Mycena galopus ATCC 62051]